MRELELIKSLESDNRDFELLAIYFEEAVSEVSFDGGPTITGEEKADNSENELPKTKP